MALADVAVRGVLAGIGLLVVVRLVLLPEWALRHVRPRVSARRDR